MNWKIYFIQAILAMTNNSRLWIIGAGSAAALTAGLAAYGRYNRSKNESQTH
jgi:high-affinity Fe2+/Pb2+ permease